MIGLTIPQNFAFSGSAAVASGLASADATFARLADGFFRSQGWQADISMKDRFVRATVPLIGEEDPHGFLRTLGNVQSLLRDKMRLVNVEQTDAGLVAHLGFAFPSLIVGLLHFLYGPQAMNAVFVSRDVERDEINRMYHRNDQPVGLFDRPVFLGDVGQMVDAFIFAYHDLYHLIFGSALSLPLRKMWAALYDRTSALPPEIVSLPVAQRLLDALTDNDVDARYVESQEMLAFVPFRGVVGRLQEAHQIDDSEEALGVFRECETFLGAFIASLGNVGDPALLHSDFLMRNLRELHRMASTQVALRSVYGEGWFF